MTVLYTSSNLYAFTLYSEQLCYSLTEHQATYFNSTVDSHFYDNKDILRTCIDDAKNAVDIGQSIYASQISLNNAAYFVNNQDLLF